MDYFAAQLHAVILQVVTIFQVAPVNCCLENGDHFKNLAMLPCNEAIGSASLMQSAHHCVALFSTTESCRVPVLSTALSTLLCSESIREKGLQAPGVYVGKAGPMAVETLRVPVICLMTHMAV